MTTKNSLTKNLLPKVSTACLINWRLLKSPLGNLSELIGNYTKKKTFIVFLWDIFFPTKMYLFCFQDTHAFVSLFDIEDLETKSLSEG